jgi:uncharacterized OB-fold protein
MTEYKKPMPMPDRVTGTFWEAAKDHKLLLQHCSDCNTTQFFPQSYCRVCLSENLEWFEAAGKGLIYSFTVVHRPPSVAFQEDIPYIVALIELDEGVMMMSTIIDIKPENVRVEMPVEVIFEDISPAISLPRFRPVDII